MNEIEARSKIKYRIGVIKEIAGNRYDVKFCEDLEIAIQALKEIREYRELGTVEELQALKEKNTPMELAEHNFQDEVHHYLCPSCRNIVSFNQNYCEECGQALEIWLGMKGGATDERTGSD